ncbi:MAG: hypothetical protein WCF84_06475 [Anaerolineae bacterium]
MADPVTAVFTVEGDLPLGTMPGVLGLWQKAGGPADSATGAVSFEAGAAPPAERWVWRIDLPADPAQARAQLVRGQAQLDRADAAMGESTERIAALVNAQAGGGSFAVTELPSPEADLLREVQAGAEGAGISFGWGEQLTGNRQAAAQALQAAVERLVHFVAYDAWVETQVEGALLGRTVVAWSGEMSTAWREGTPPAQVELHTRALRLALASRNTLIRSFAIAGQGAVLLASLPALAATPAGILIALPAVWKFVNQIMSEGDLYGKRV